MCGKRRFGEHHDGQTVLKKPRRLSFEYESRGFPEIQISYTATGNWPPMRFLRYSFLWAAESAFYSQLIGVHLPGRYALNARHRFRFRLSRMSR